MTMLAEDTLHRLFVLVHGDTLPATPDITGTDLARAMDARKALGYSCRMCPNVARFALTLGPSDLVGVRRWLDVCASCNRALRILGDAIDCGALDVTGMDGDGELPIPITGDAAVLIRYKRWLAAAS